MLFASLNAPKIFEEVRRAPAWLARLYSQVAPGEWLGRQMMRVVTALVPAKERAAGSAKAG